MFKQQRNAKRGLLVAMGIMIIMAGMYIMPAVASMNKYRGITIKLAGVTGSPTKSLNEDLIPMFEKKTGIRIKATYLAHAALTQKTLTALAGGTKAFDVIMLGDEWKIRYNPFLEDLFPYLNNPRLADPEYDKDDILRGVFQAAVYKGKLCGLPYRVLGRMLYYRKDIFEKVGLAESPRTLEELRDYAQKCTLDLNGDGNVDIYGYAYMAKQGMANAYTLTEMIHLAGGELWDDNYVIKINTEPGIYALTLWQDMYIKYKCVPPECVSWEWDEIISGGQQGRWAMCVLHTPYATLIDNPATSKTAGLWGYAHFPVRGNVRGGKPTLGEWIFGISKDSPHKEAAYKFIEFVTSKGAQIVSAFNKNGPVRMSSYTDPGVAIMWPWAPVVVQVLEDGKPMPPDFLAVELRMAGIASKLTVGTLSPREAAKEIENAAMVELTAAGHSPTVGR